MFGRLFGKRGALAGICKSKPAVKFVPKNIALKILSLTTLGLIFFVQTSVLAVSIAQGYLTDDKDLVVGMAASEKTIGSSSKPLVERSTPDSIDSFVGIVTTKEASSFSVTNSQTNVVVVLSGTASGLVSDINGVVKKGDHLSISPIRGVLAKTVDTNTTYVGIATEDMDISKAVSQDMLDSAGHSITARVSGVSITITGSKTSTTADSGKKTVFLSSFVKTLTGKDVNQWRTVTALIIFFVLIVTVGSIVYSAVSTAIDAMGRNPLAKHSIYHQLTEVALVVGGVLLLGGFVIYLVIWV